MRTSLIMLVSALVAVICWGQGAQGQPGSSIEKPTWQIGDAWEVRGPIYERLSFATPATAHPRPRPAPRKVSEYSLAMQVIARTPVRGHECFVLEIRPEKDLPEQWRLAQPAIFAERVYYRVSDFMLMRVEQSDMSAGKEHVSSHFDWIPENRWDVPADAEAPEWSAPLQLPVFAVRSDQNAERYTRHERYSSIREAAKRGEDALTASTWVIAARALAALQAVAGQPGLSVSFTERLTYSKSGQHDRLLLEEVWVPGQPWWSVARRHDATGVVKEWEFALVEHSFKHETFDPGKLSLAPFSSPSPVIQPDAPTSGSFAERKEVLPPILDVVTGHEEISATYRDPSGIDVASVRIYVDKVDCTAEATITANGLRLHNADDSIVPDLDGPHRIEVRVRDVYGNLQAISASSHVIDPEGIDPANPAPKTITISYYLYRDGDVLIRMREPEQTRPYHTVKLHQRSGLRTFTWNGKDDHGHFLPQGSSVIEIFYGDRKPLERIGSLEIP